MKPYLIGLTGSIGMGKSTAARMFAIQPDVALWDADAAVHRLYSGGGRIVAAIGEICPDAVQNGVDRGKLKSWIARDPTALKQLETIVHPFVARDRAEFVESCAEPICVLDVPLLFETGYDGQMDLVVVVSTDAQTQESRVLERGMMTKEQFSQILAAQMPDAEKREKADFVIDSATFETAQIAVDEILEYVRSLIDA